MTLIVRAENVGRNSRNLDDYSALNVVHKRGNKAEAENIHNEKCRIWYNGINQAENRKGAVEVWADKIHVKCIVHTKFSKQVIHSDIQSHSNENKPCENGNTLEEEAVRKPTSFVNHNEHSKHYLHAVVNHSLYIYAEALDEHVVGIKHNCYSREEREGSRKGNKCVSHLSVF